MLLVDQVSAEHRELLQRWLTPIDAEAFAAAASQLAVAEQAGNAVSLPVCRRFDLLVCIVWKTYF
jgi:hypothetical protein